jgi:hypothetical protein
MVLDLILRVCLVLLFAAAAGLEDGLLLPCAPGLKRPLRRKRDGRTRLLRFWNCSVCIRLENP